MSNLMTLSEALAQAGKRPIGVGDEEWLLIAHERMCLRAAELASPMEDAEAYGVLRQEVRRKLEAGRPASSADPLDPREEFVGRVISEVERAYAKHGRELWSRHEFFAILLEEVEEVKEAVWKDHPSEALEKEVIQVAAMCLRYFETRDRLDGGASL